MGDISNTWCHGLDWCLCGVFQGTLAFLLSLKSSSCDCNPYSAIVLYEPIIDLQGQVRSRLSLPCCCSGQMFLDHASQAFLPYPRPTLHTSMHRTYPSSWSERLQFLRSLSNSHCHTDVKWIYSAWLTCNKQAVNCPSVTVTKSQATILAGVLASLHSKQIACKLAAIMLHGQAQPAIIFQRKFNPSP